MSTRPEILSRFEEAPVAQNGTDPQRRGAAQRQEIFSIEPGLANSQSGNSSPNHTRRLIMQSAGRGVSTEGRVQDRMVSGIGEVDANITPAVQVSPLALQRPAKENKDTEPRIDSRGMESKNAEESPSNGWWSSLTKKFSEGWRLVVDATLGARRLTNDAAAFTVDQAVAASTNTAQARAPKIGALKSVASLALMVVSYPVGLAYNGICSGINGALEWCSEIPQRVSAAVVGVVKACIESPKEVAASIYSSWISTSQAIQAGLVVAKDALFGLGRLCVAVGSFLFDVAKTVWNEPERVFADVIRAGKTCFNLALKVGGYALERLVNGIAWCIENPGQILPALWSGVSGLWNVGCALVGVLVPFALDAAQKLWGGIKKVLNGEVSLGEALLKTFLFACECSGLSSACGTLRHGVLALAAYGKGDTAAFREHLEHAAMRGCELFVALRYTSVAVVAAPLLVPLMAVQCVVSVFLKQGLKTCAREFLECGAKKIAESAIKHMGEPAVAKLAKESPEELVKVAASAKKMVGAGASAEVLAQKTQELALERVIQLQGENIAKTMGRSMSDDIRKHGAEQVLHPSYVNELGEQVGYTQTRALLHELGLADRLDGLPFKLLSSMKEMSHKEAREHIMNTMQIGAKEADRMAREVQRLVKSGKSEAAIKQLLEEQITNDVSKFVAVKMEGSFKETFRKGLRGELTDKDNLAWSKNLSEAVQKQAKKLDKNVDGFIDELVNAGWEGVERGIKRATSELVLEGLERAFKRLREKVALRMPVAAGERAATQSVATVVNATTSSGDQKPADKSATLGAAGQPKASIRELEVKRNLVTRPDGTVVVVVSTFEGEQLLEQDEQVVSGPVPNVRVDSSVYGDPTFGTSVYGDSRYSGAESREFSSVHLVSTASQSVPAEQSNPEQSEPGQLQHKDKPLLAKQERLVRLARGTPRQSPPGAGKTTSSA